MKRSFLITLALVTLALALSANVPATAQTAAGIAEKPAAVTADGIPSIAITLTAATRPYMEFRTAGFSAWNPVDRSMLIGTRFAATSQLHKVVTPGGARSQLTFESEPVRGGSFAPVRGDVLLIQKDIGGNEFYQIFRVDNGRLELLTDGESRNRLGAWTHDGKYVTFSSTKRTGRDTDLYIMDPRDPSTTRLFAEREGGGWFVVGFTPDNKTALVLNYISITNTELYHIDVATGKETRLTSPDKPVAFSAMEYAPDGRLWVSSDEGSDFKRIGTFDPQNGTFTPVIEEDWDITGFDISDDGKFLAYVVNVAGQSALKIYNISRKRTRPVPLPPGVIGGLEIAPWGEIGFTFISNQAAADAYSINPKNLKLTRWTTSETGGLDPTQNVLPELVEIESFDGEKVSGFLYRPSADKFDGARPLIINIHGGPEGQSRATFRGRTNYLINELGVAVFYPNVRGSTGFGKRFVALDNGPFKREDSVKDIGAFLDHLSADPAINAKRIAVSGGSYGGYMCYASAIFYGERLKAANCVVAISNFVTFLENTQDYRRDLRRPEYGDERDPKQRKKLLEISPLTRADEIRIPLMVATGANDPRVPASEADQIIKVIRANGGEAWHFLAGNEGHGFAKKENADYYFWSSLAFWQKHLLAE